MLKTHMFYDKQRRQSSQLGHASGNHPKRQPRNTKGKDGKGMDGKKGGKVGDRDRDRFRDHRDDRRERSRRR